MNTGAPIFREIKRWLGYGAVGLGKKAAEFVNNIGEETKAKEEKEHKTKEDIIADLGGQWGVSVAYSWGLLKDKDLQNEDEKER